MRCYITVSQEEIDVMGTDLESPQWALFFTGIMMSHRVPVHITNGQLEEQPGEVQYISFEGCGNEQIH